MTFGKNQTSARDKNLEIIIEHLQKESLSRSDLALKMQLSKTALGKIVDEMLLNNLVILSEEKGPNQVGRKKVLYEINKDAGLVLAINFAGHHVSVTIANLKHEILDEVKVEGIDFISKKDLLEINKVIESFIKKYTNEKRKLLYIGIAAAGKIERESQTFKQSPKFSKLEGLNLKEYYEELFKVPAFLKNDINLMLLGEIEKNASLKELKDILLIHIDAGIGGAVYNKGSIVEGEHGYAGEFGLIKTFDKMGNVTYLDTACSINALKNKIKYYKSTGEETSVLDVSKTKNIIKAFHENDYLVRRLVLESAKIIGVVISNLYNTFDISNVLISGEGRLFGEDYLDEIKNNLGRERDEINLNFTTRGDEAITCGALSVAIKEAFKELINNRKNGK